VSCAVIVAWDRVNQRKENLVLCAPERWVHAFKGRRSLRTVRNNLNEGCVFVPVNGMDEGVWLSRKRAWLVEKGCGKKEYDMHGCSF
jgi:hypothetical protein